MSSLFHIKKNTFAFFFFFSILDFVTSIYAFGDPRKNAIMNLDTFQTNWKEAHSIFLLWYPVLADEESRKLKQHSFTALGLFLPSSHQFVSADLPCLVKYIDSITASGHIRQRKKKKNSYKGQAARGAGNSVGCL